MGNQSRFYIDPDGIVQPAYPNTVLPPGTKVYSTREAAKSAIPANRWFNLYNVSSCRSRR